MKEFPENKIDVTVTEKKDKERKERKRLEKSATYKSTVTNMTTLWTCCCYINY